MAFSFFAQSQDEKPYQIGSDILVSHYLKESKLKSIESFNNRLTLNFEGVGHTCLVIETNSNATVTFRSIIGRRR